MDSHLQDSWTAISASDMLIGDGTEGNTSVNNSPDNGPRRLDYIQAKIDHWHSTWVQACQDRLFTRDCKWVNKSRNLEPGDMLWLIQDSKLKKTLKWVIVQKVFPDQLGMLRDIVVRYIIPKPGLHIKSLSHSQQNLWQSKMWP